MNIDLVKRGKIFLFISVFLAVLSLISFFTLGLNYGIDFTGGTTLTYQFSTSQDTTALSNKVKAALGSSVKSAPKITELQSNTYQIQTTPLNTPQVEKVESEFPMKPQSVSTVGPSIGGELRQDSFISISLVILGIILYIAWAFRKVPKPTSSFTFGLTAVVAMLHDVLIVVGVFAVLGYFFDAPVDTLFVTALLTVMGFSVHDTIVVFDRIRENLKLKKGLPFPSIVNESLIQTLGRSINTSMTVLLVLFATFILGGESIRWFVLALLIGIASGTYSSIFVASQALVLWETRKSKLKG